MTNIERARTWLTGVGSLHRFDDRAASLASMLDEAERRGAGLANDEEHRRQYPHGCASRGKCLICHPIVGVNDPKHVRPADHDATETRGVKDR